MRAWLYYRLSRDEDEELNSLMNQRSIIESYALNHGYTIVGESCDDNISGMHFDRDGIEQLTEAVDAGLIDAVIVKDLSRLGRHRMQTALFVDYLRQYGVSIISATEGLNTMDDRDDLIIGIRQLNDERCGKADGKVYRWTYQSVKNILTEESYTGLLVNHRTETHGRTVTSVPKDEQYRHENFYPVIVEREEWEQVQTLLKVNAKPYRGNTVSHRYAGLLACGDCGRTFVPKIRCWNGNRRVEYLCGSYMHHGKAFCPSHRIRESELDARVQQYAKELRSRWAAEQADLCRLHRLWEMKRPAINTHAAALHDEIRRLEQKIDDLLLEKIQGGY